MTRTSPSRIRRLLTSRLVTLPIVAAGLLALAPLQAAGLFQRWQALAQSAPGTAGQAPVASGVAAPGGAAPGGAARGSGVSGSAAPDSVASDPAAVSALAPRSNIIPGLAPGSATLPPGPGFSSSSQRPADGKLLEELNQRAAELDQREHDLQTRATQVAAAERLARAQLAELGQMRTDLEKVVAREGAASDEDVAVLVGLYSNMKPSQAAVLLGHLDAAKAATILAKLDIHSAGPALAAMEPSVAVAITEELSRRHAPFRP